MSLWKWVGLAGIVGVTAGGVLVARNQRQRAAYSPSQIRERLHRRYAEAVSRSTSDSTTS